ncbi:hypothetical protein SDJN02_11195, partial [Cucurbita argyrosperma subsp. argyrosperma]
MAALTSLDEFGGGVSMHSSDSHWFLPMESPTNTILPFRVLSNSSLALNLRLEQENGYQPYQIQDYTKSLKLIILLYAKNENSSSQITSRQVAYSHVHTWEYHSHPAATATSGNLHLSGHSEYTGILDQQRGNSQYRSEMDNFHPKPISHWSNHKLSATETSSSTTNSGRFRERFATRTDANVRDHNTGD